MRVGEESKAHKERVSVLSLELEYTFKSSSKCGACIPVFVGGGRFLRGRGGFFGIEVLNCP